jgi:uncharacterized membrane protein YhaH (DUF805 family)
MFHYCLQIWKKRNTFTGRARRKEYLICQLGTLFVLIGVAFAVAQADYERNKRNRHQQQEITRWHLEPNAPIGNTLNIAEVMAAHPTVKPTIKRVRNSTEDSDLAKNGSKYPKSREVEPVTIRQSPKPERGVALDDGAVDRFWIAMGSGMVNNTITQAIVGAFDSTSFQPAPTFDAVKYATALRDKGFAGQGINIDDNAYDDLVEARSEAEAKYILDKRHNMIIGDRAQSLNSAGAFLGSPYVFLVLLIIRLNAAVSIRRLHDVGKSGWFMLIGLVPIVNLYLVYLTCIKKGDVGHNQYGPDPKHED